MKAENKIKKRECWVVGGIIGIIFFMIYFFIVNYIPKFNRFICIDGEYNFFNCTGIKYLEFIGSPAHFIIKNIGFLNNLGTSGKGILAVIILLIFYFLIGALIGCVYEKIKGRKKK